MPDSSHCRSQPLENIIGQTESQRALSKSEQQFRRLVELAPEAIVLLDPVSDRLVEANPKAEGIFGCTRDELLSVAFQQFYAAAQPDNVPVRESISEHTRRVLSGEEVTFECAIISAKGERRYCEVRLAAFPSDERQLILASFIDVSQRKRAEQALRESEHRFRVMADSAPVMMWMSNPEKACIDFNRGWLEFTGRTLWQELGDGWVEGVHPVDLERCFRTYSSAFDERRQFTMEYRMRRHDGVYRLILDTGVPRFLVDGSFAGYIGCCIDINDQREAEKTRLELAGRLMTAQEAERTRIARELHDGIGQSIALLGIQMQRADQPVSGASDRRNPSVEELCEKLMEIGNQVSRLSHQLHPWKLEFLGLAVTVKSLCRQFSEEYHIAVNCRCIDVPTNLENDVSLCFLRVAQEALHNIAKHSHATRVQVLLVGTARRLTLVVRDNGAGFEANTVSNVHPRAGLGLISMRERLHLIGGDFAISSEPGQGTRIEVHAPLLAMAQ